MYDFDRIVKAAESCDFHGEFASDIKHCENALSMGGLMAINAECWLDVLNAMRIPKLQSMFALNISPVS